MLTVGVKTAGLYRVQVKWPFSSTTPQRSPMNRTLPPSFIINLLRLLYEEEFNGDALATTQVQKKINILGHVRRRVQSPHSIIITSLKKMTKVQRISYLSIMVSAFTFSPALRNPGFVYQWSVEHYGAHGRKKLSRKEASRYFGVRKVSLPFGGAAGGGCWCHKRKRE